MRFSFSFGKTGLTLDLPDRFRYLPLEARSARPLSDEQAAIAQALDEPVASPPLRDLARGRSSAAISVCDITRPVPNSRILPPLLDRIEQAGIPKDRITILIATGLHRPANKGEIEEIVGSEIAKIYRVENHNARELAEHRHLGRTSAGTEVYIDERFVAADLHITIGFIEPHLMLGYSGGRKLIAPGLAAQETIKVLHSPRFMRDPRTHEGSIEDNPLHRELLEIAAMARHDFMVDVALTRERRIAGVFAGNPVEAHRAGAGFVSQVMIEELPEPVDAAITSAAGYPLDLTFYQSVKGLTAAQHIIRPGGRILLVAACQEGPGAPEFRQMLKTEPSAQAFMEKILGAPVIVDQWQLEKLGMVSEKLDLLYYVPGLSADYYPTLWGKAYESPEAALEALFDGLPDGARVALIPEGPYVLAKVREAAALGAG
jgi:lactate racemase